MKTKFYLLILTFLVLALPKAHSQELIVFEETVSESYLVKYDRNPTGNAVLTNQMIETLATGNQKSVYATEYSFTYDILSRISKKKPNFYEVYVTLKNPRLQGDVFYRGFDVAAPLLPSEANFSIMILDNQGGLVKKQSFLSTPLEEYPTPMAVMQIKDTSGATESHKIQVRDKMFFYRNLNLEQFTERTGFIDSYYQAGNMLDQASVDLGTVRPQDFDNIQTHNARLTEIERMIGNIQQQDHAGLLPLSPETDYIQLIPKMQNVRDKAGILRQRMDDTFAQLPGLFVQRGLDYLGARNEQAAIQDFNKALELDPNFAPAHLELARLDFQRGNLPAVEQAITNILGNSTLDPSTRASTVGLARDLYGFYLDKGVNRNTNNEFSSALEQFDGALRVCTNVSEVICGNDLMLGMTTAKKGIYTRHLDQAKAKLDAGELEAALESVDAARGFRVANSQDITDPTRENQLFDFIQGARYRKDVSKGKELMGMKKYREALQLFDDAFAMETKFNIVRDPAVPELRKQAAKPVIRAMIEEGLMQVQSNHLDRARETGKVVQEWQGIYGLSEDPDLKAKYGQLKGKIFSQECTNAQNELNVILSEGKSHISQQDYIAAEGKFKEALAVIARNGACGLDDSEARTNRVQVADAAAYQRKMREIDGKVNRNLASQAIIDLEAADQFFRSNNIDRYGLKHPSVFEYIDGTGSKNLHLAGAQYFSGKKQPEMALDLLRKLAGWGFPKKQMKFVAMEVGRQLAEIEHPLNSGGNPKTVVEKYYRGNKGLKHMRKGFIKRWKSL